MVHPSHDPHNLKCDYIFLRKKNEEVRKGKKKRWDWESWRLHFSGRLLLIKMLKAILTPFLTTVTILTDLQISILGLSNWTSMFCQDVLGPVMGLIIATHETISPHLHKVPHQVILTN